MLVAVERVDTEEREVVMRSWSACAVMVCLVMGCDGEPDTPGDAADMPASGADQGDVQDLATAPDQGAQDQDAALDQDVEDQSAAPDMAPDMEITPRRVSAFIAQGHLGRTTVSCDGGLTWGADRSDEDVAHCWSDAPDAIECDHTSGAGRGIASDAQGFVATFGWGQPGAVKRSEDGQTWSDVLPGKTFGGVAFGADIWLAAARDPQRSTDGGMTWEASGPSMMAGYNVRRAGFAPLPDGGLFVMVGDAGDVVTSPDAATWSAAQVPDGCGKDIQTEGGIASLGGVILILGGDGSACRSADGGQTWTMHSAGGDVSSHLVTQGGQFMAWSRGKRYASPDGATWTAADITPNTITIGPAAASPEGALVGVRGGWQVWYEKQEFYRSADGLTWDVLPAASFTGGHPIRAIAHGTLAPGGACP